MTTLHPTLSMTNDQQAVLDALALVKPDTISQEFVNEVIRVMSVKQALRDRGFNQVVKKAAAVVTQHANQSVISRLLQRANAGQAQDPVSKTTHSQSTTASKDARRVAYGATLTVGDVIEVEGTRTGTKFIRVTKVDLAARKVYGQEVYYYNGWCPRTTTRITNHSFNKIVRMYDPAKKMWKVIA